MKNFAYDKYNPTLRPPHQAQKLDIEETQEILGWFHIKMGKVWGVLEAKREHELADLNREDFKRLEKEDERHRQRKSAEIEGFDVSRRKVLVMDSLTKVEKLVDIGG